MTLNEMQEKGAELAKELTAISHVQAAKCYQCGKCSAGCPVAAYMDITPSQVMRLVQLGLIDEALHSKAIWLCASCETCSTRCPREVDIAHEMETLRILAKSKGYVGVKNMDKFHDIFLDLVKHAGRVYEVGLIVERNLKTGKLFQDVSYGLPYLTKGKISLLPHRIKNVNEVKQIFARAEIVAKREAAAGKEQA